MKKPLFVCDLDKTLIHSYKHKKEGDVCVEIIKDKEQGYMSPLAMELLCRVSKRVELVPVTSRSIEQYLRINFPKDCEIRYAVTTNGAILLENGKIVSHYYEESSRFAEKYRQEFEELKNALIDEDLYVRCRIVDEMYLFAYCKEGVDIKECQKKYQPLTDLVVSPSGKKLYLFPPEFNKGEAISRLRSIIDTDTVYSAGDTSIDVPMLKKADCSFVPGLSIEGIDECVKSTKVIVCPENERFSEFILKSILEMTE